jgi:hypothetical protein
MHPSMEEFMIYPEELKRIFIFSYMSIKISLLVVLLLTETLEAEEFMVFGEKSEKLLNFFMSKIPLCLASTTSLAINGFI